MQKIQSMKAALKDQKLMLNLIVNRDFTLEQGLITDKEEFFNEVFSIRPVLKVKRQM